MDYSCIGCLIDNYITPSLQSLGHQVPEMVLRGAMLITDVRREVDYLKWNLLHPELKSLSLSLFGNVAGSGLSSEVFLFSLLVWRRA